MARKTIEEKLKTVNLGHKIKIRLKQLKEVKRFFLDIFSNYKHEYFFLDLYATGDYTKDDYALKIAEEIRKRKEVELLDSKTGFRLSNHSKVNFREYYIKKVKQKNPANQSNYIVSLEKFMRYVKNENFTFDDLNEKVLKGYLKHLEKQDLSHVSVLDYFNHLKIIIKLAINDKVLVNNPAINIKLQKKEIIKVFLTVDELKKLYDTESIRPQIKNAFLFACFTGLRISDLTQLKWSSIQDNKMIIVQQKTNNIVSVALSKTAQAIIDDQKNYDNGVYVFHLLEKNRTRKHLKEWVRISGITKNVSFHTARHTFATLCISSGIDLYTTSKLLGHTDIKTTQQYAKLVDKKKDEAIDKLPEL